MTRTPGSGKSNGRWIAGGIAIAVVIALVVALVAGGSESESEAISDPTVASAPSGSAGENQPVVVEGQALDPLGTTGADVSVGAPAPALSGFAFDGTPVEVRPGDGQPYMVVFLAHWCPHCNAEVPRLVEWNDQGMVPSSLRVVGVSTAVAADRPNFPPSQWVIDKGWPFAVMADSEEMDAAAAYGVDGFPFFAIVGSDGSVKVRASGEQGLEAIDALVTAALADE